MVFDLLSSAAFQFSGFIWFQGPFASTTAAPKKSVLPLITDATYIGASQGQKLLQLFSCAQVHGKLVRILLLEVTHTCLQVQFLVVNLAGIFPVIQETSSFI